MELGVHSPLDLLTEYDRVLEMIQEHREALAQLEASRDAIREKLAQRLAQDNTSAPQPPSHLYPRRPAQGTNANTLETVRDLGGIVDSYRLAEKLDITVDAAQLRLMRAYAKGYLTRVRRGGYTLPGAIEKSEDAAE